MKKALVLAGGTPQITLIQELQKRGYFVLLADYNDNPVAKKYCDKYYQVSTLDVPAIRKISEEENVSFLITVCTDQALLTVAQVSEELGLPCYIDYQTALNVTNKKYMKELFAEKDIPTAKFVLLEELDPEKLIGLSYPLISKPVDCNSSKGVKKSTNFDELSENFEEAKALSRSGLVVVEEFIEGKEISVDVYVDNGTAVLLDTSSLQKIDQKDSFVIFRGIGPIVRDENNRKKITEIAQKIADAFHITDSPMLIQMLVRDGEYYVIEFSARTGGGEKFLRIIEDAGFDPIKAVVDLTEGRKPDVAISLNKIVDLVEFIYCYPGTYDHIEGFEALKAAGIIKHPMVFKTKGAKFDTIKNSGDRIAGYMIIGNSVEEVEAKREIANKGFKVIDENGEDIARHDILEIPVSETFL